MTSRSGLKLFLTGTLLLALWLGLTLPVPGHRHEPAARSSFDTVDLDGRP